MSTPIRTVECKYNKCGKSFTSKPRMKEHVLWHLETDPPVRVHQHAIVRELVSGGWVVVRDLGFSEGSGTAGAGGSSQVGNDSEIDKFRITDIVPSASQAGNITTTTTTSGTTSQPYPFSPALPTQPSQLTLPSQTPLRPYNSLPLKSASPFVHSAPKPSPTPSPSVIRKRLPTTSPALMASPVKRTRLSPFPIHDGVISSTPILRETQHSTQSDSSQFPPPSGKEIEVKDTPIKEAKRTFGFGEALGLSEKQVTPDVKSGVTFGFGTR